MPSFLGKELFCASHIKDETIHLTAEQQTYLKEPVDTGIYTGRGNGSYSVNLGFRPRVVFVASHNQPLMICDFENQKCYALAGLAVDNGNSLGVEITDTGFKVINSSTMLSRGCYPLLNEGGTSYRYIAFR